VYLKKQNFHYAPDWIKGYAMLAMIMAVFWLALYVLVNLTSNIVFRELKGSISGLILLCVWFSLAFCGNDYIGGMKVIGYTDVIQVLI
jgi:SSS family solute:Na+ symporter